MERSLVESARAYADSNTDSARHKVWWACQDECNGTVEAKTADDGWEEIVEATRAEMLWTVSKIAVAKTVRFMTYHVLHEAEDVETWISNSLHECCLCTFARFHTDSVFLNSQMSELSLSWSQPSSGEGKVW